MFRYPVKTNGYKLIIISTIVDATNAIAQQERAIS